MKNKNKAFTLIELLITIAIVSLLVTVALPYMGTLVANNVAREAASMMELDLLYARNTAVTREVSVGVTPVSDEFENGWRVAVFSGGSETELLRNRDALDDRVDITTGDYTTSAPLMFNNKGALTAGGTITICTDGSAGDVDTQISLLSSGQTSFRRISC